MYYFVPSHFIPLTSPMCPAHPMEELYGQVPTLACRGFCGRDRSDTCCGPIACTDLEAALLDQYDGQQSSWTPVQPGNRMMTSVGSLCPHLGLDGRCTAYEVRPLICRLWGTTPDLRCPWGCTPSRWLPDSTARQLLERARRRSLQLTQKEPSA